MMSMDNGRQEQVSVADPERSEGLLPRCPALTRKCQRRRSAGGSLRGTSYGSSTLAIRPPYLPSPRISNNTCRWHRIVKKNTSF